VATLLALLLAACLPLATPLPPLPSQTPTPTQSATPTIIWFPPSATPTRLPTAALSLTPSPDLSPRYGALLFEDDFSQPENWILGRTLDGSMALGANELTLAVNRARGYLFSLYQGASLGDFYAEITASPSLCRGQDEYGLLLHVSPALEFFRFGLNCSGQARVDRLFKGQASSPQPLVFSGAVPPGAPSISRLAVWSQGREMRFYANGEYLFAVRDPSLPSGAIGVFARAAGEEVLTVNFSSLKVYEVEP